MADVGREGGAIEKEKGEGVEGGEGAKKGRSGEDEGAGKSR